MRFKYSLVISKHCHIWGCAVALNIISRWADLWCICQWFYKLPLWLSSQSLLDYIFFAKSISEILTWEISPLNSSFNEKTAVVHKNGNIHEVTCHSDAALIYVGGSSANLHAFALWLNVAMWLGISYWCCFSVVCVCLLESRLAPHSINCPPWSLKQ